MSSELRETHRLVERTPGVALELRRYWTREGTPHVVVIKGLGGSASRDRLIDELAQHFTVHALSPRGAGLSTGHLTVEQHVSDLIEVCGLIERESGRKPFGLGHSFGGFALARALGTARVVEKAVLLAPLLHILEQNPAWLNAHLRRHVMRGHVPWTLRAFASLYNAFIKPADEARAPDGLALSQQRFERHAVLPFLHSLLHADACSAPLGAPTLVMLAGRSNVGRRIANLDELARVWSTLGAEVETHAHLDHFMSRGGGFFDSEHTHALTTRIRGFLVDGNSARAGA